jgi:hypothetical protein
MAVYSACISYAPVAGPINFNAPASHGGKRFGFAS